MSNKFFNWKEMWKIIKEHVFVCAEIIEENKDKIKILIELGKIKDMSKEKVTLTKLYDMMVQFKDQVNDRFDRLEKRVENIEKDVSVLKSDVALIKSCPTIKKEIAKLILASNCSKIHINNNPLFLIIFMIKLFFAF